MNLKKFFKLLPLPQGRFGKVSSGKSSTTVSNKNSPFTLKNRISIHPTLAKSGQKNEPDTPPLNFPK